MKISISIGEDLLGRLDKWAKENHRSRSNALHCIVDRFLLNDETRITKTRRWNVFPDITPEPIPCCKGGEVTCEEIMQEDHRDIDYPQTVHGGNTSTSGRGGCGT